MVLRSSVSAKRKGDAVVTVRQDSLERKVEIVSVNRAAEKLLGYSHVDIEGQDVQVIFPERISDTIDGYVDYEDETSDFASVVRRVPNFQILNRKGELVPVSLKIFYMISSRPEMAEYELLMRDITLIQKVEELKARMVASNEGEVVSPVTGLVGGVAVRHAIDLVLSFVRQTPIDVCYAVIAIDHVEEYQKEHGGDVLSELIRFVGDEVKRICRDEDVVGYLGEGKIGVVLLDCSVESAQNVLKRINADIDAGKVSLSGGSAVSISLSMVYTQLKKDHESDVVYHDCLDASIKDAEVGEHILRYL